MRNLIFLLALAFCFGVLLFINFLVAIGTLGVLCIMFCGVRLGYWKAKKEFELSKLIDLEEKKETLKEVEALIEPQEIQAVSNVSSKKEIKEEVNREIESLRDDGSD